MTKVFALASIAVLAGRAAALPFRALSYEAGGGLPGIAGAGYSVDFGGFFVADAAGTNVITGTANNYTAANEQEFDSHFSLYGFGPAARHRLVSPSNNSNLTRNFYGDYYSLEFPVNYDELEAFVPIGRGPFCEIGASYVVGPGSHVGDPIGDGSNPEHLARAGLAVAPPPVYSHFAPNATGGRSSFDGIYVGRLTIKAGAALSGGIFFNTAPAFGESDGHDLVLGGAPVPFDTHNGPQLLALRAYQINLQGPITLSNPSSATAEGLIVGNPFGPANVLDLWVQVVPGPGTGVIIASAMLVWSRRRRG